MSWESSNDHHHHPPVSSSAVAASSGAQVAFSAPVGAPAGLSFEEWVAVVRRRSGRHHSPLGTPSFPAINVASPSSAHAPQISAGPDPGDLDSEGQQPCDQAQETSLLQRLGNAAILDIESNEFSWDALSSLHHTKQTSMIENSEDEMNKSLEVTVNSGGVVFYALFKTAKTNGPSSVPVEAAAVIKFSTSRMATQSERLGYEFARMLGVRTPQARVVHNSSAEWQSIKDGAEQARDIAVSSMDEVGELTCTELLEALELSRCLYIMSYIHGAPLLENSNAFGSREAAEITAAALGRVLLLDLVVRNEDRLPCPQLGWRGNSANLLFTDKLAQADTYLFEDIYYPTSRVVRHPIVKSLKKERITNSVSARLVMSQPGTMSPNASSDEDSTHASLKKEGSGETNSVNFHIVAIDSGVPRRPPAGKRLKDQECYPKVVELMLHSSEFAAHLLYEVSGCKLGFPPIQEDSVFTSSTILSRSKADIAAVVHEFRRGFRAAYRNLQSFHLFLLTLHQKLEGLLSVFLSIIDKSNGELDKYDSGALDSPSHSSLASICKDRSAQETHAELNECDMHNKPIYTSSTPARRDSVELSSPLSHENLNSKSFKGSVEPPRCLRLTMKLRDFNKLGKVDAELNKEMEQWNEMFRSDVIKLCQENNFNSGFFEGNEQNIVIDAYELKVRIEHILERVALISDAASTERPSSITGTLFIGGALAARSLYTLQHLGITHILCLCSHEIGQSDSQYPDLFNYHNFSIDDSEDENISTLFEDSTDLLNNVECSGGKVLVHCFEGRSRSATVVLAYLILRKGLTLQEAWNMLKKAHRRAQPNDGFARALVDLDRRIHGKASMGWPQRKPVIKGPSIAP